ncbi:MAG: hypothetical protein EPO51_01305 [Phenylobacterium sp.]|uniref:hypothetical protein n=1 Tax=Phenylobacterium sp. TaxID=1871053 RepID=UPI00121723AA|nr:hypothetical protein [Phenylobacterium sp.]TAJ74722.1 MAG: hypothetical protein EPO51_01305 [Phenylobacterium sp.]
MQSNTLHIVVATPCYGGVVTQRYMQSVCGLMLAATHDNVAITLQLLGNDSMITRARNSLVATTLDNSDATHLMFIDADIGFTPDQVGRMLRFDQDVVAGMYPLKVVDDSEQAMRRFAEGEPMETAQLRYLGAFLAPDLRRETDGFVTAEFAGTGFMLIKRRALERMIDAYPQLRFTAVHDRARPVESPNQYALFDGMIDPESGHYLSEDYTFCRRWRDIGGDVWLDTRSRLTHVGSRDFAGDAGRRFGL